MAAEHKLTVVGHTSGDMECWCLEVSEQEFRRVMGKDAYRWYLKRRKDEVADGFEPTPWRIYPQDLLGDHQHPVQISIKVRPV